MSKKPINGVLDILSRDSGENVKEAIHHDTYTISQASASPFLPCVPKPSRSSPYNYLGIVVVSIPNLPLTPLAPTHSPPPPPNLKPQTSLSSSLKTPSSNGPSPRVSSSAPVVLNFSRKQPHERSDPRPLNAACASRCGARIILVPLLRYC